MREGRLTGDGVNRACTCTPPRCRMRGRYITGRIVGPFAAVSSVASPLEEEATCLFLIVGVIHSRIWTLRCQNKDMMKIIIAGLILTINMGY